jgi:hypothetical protein
MFAIDQRSLAIFRIGVAVILLCDLANRAWDLGAFYTDDGLLPRVTRMEMLGYGDPLGMQNQWSIHLLNGQAWSQALLIGLAAWFATWLLVGYRTQLAAVASWLLLTSLDDRNPLVLDAGDSILRSMLFWSLFLPLGSRWSMDRELQGGAEPETGPIVSIPSAVILLQLAIVYMASATFKWNPVWIRDFSAVYYALHADTLVTQWGLILRQYPAAMQCLTAATMVLEIGGPLVVFSPWANPWFRGMAVVSFVTFHLGLALALTLGLFPWICIVAWMLFVPTQFWDWLAERKPIQKLAQHLRGWMIGAADRIPAAWRARGERPRMRAPWWRQIAVGLLFLYIVTWNVREILGAAWVDRVMPHRYNGLACALGLMQNWGMFAPAPRMDDGWLVMKGTLRDGTEVNLWEPGRPLPWEKPRLVSAMYPSMRWRNYLVGLSNDRFAFHRQHLANWLQRRWDREYSNGREEKTVATVELIYQLEVTPPPGEPIPKPESVELCVRHY